MNKVFFGVIALVLMGAGCAQTAGVNTNVNANMEVGATEESSGETQNTNVNTAVSGSVNVNAEVDSILKETGDEQTNEASGDESDLTTAETLDLDAMIGASGNY